VIRIVRNEAGNCVNFYGSSNPTYWNACLSAQVDSSDPTVINVVNDIITSQTGVTQYEFYNIPFTEFEDADGNAFATAQEAADYITAKANVTGVGEGIDLNGQSIDFKLDPTSTSIIMDNGFHYGVNSIKAVAHTDGTIHLESIGGSKTFFYGLSEQDVTVNGVSASGGLSDVVDALNELFTVGAFEQVVIRDPYSTLVADVSGTTITGELAGNAVDPISADIATGSSPSHYNKYGYKSTDEIDQAGEYFTFDVRGESIIGLGLINTTRDEDNDYTLDGGIGDPENFCTGLGNGHYGYQFSLWFHPTPNGPWTVYGHNSSYVMGPGWGGFPSSDEGAGWLADSPTKLRVGLDASGFISVDYYDVSESSWIVMARTPYVALQGDKYRLGIKFTDGNASLVDTPKIHLLEPAAPAMYFRYIESPDGNFEYPLFATEEEANYYDLNHSGTVGTGTSHTHTYADDPTATTWYMPDTGGIMNGTTPPQDAAHTVFMGNAVTYTEISSLTNSDLAPAAPTFADLTQEEGTVVNMQLQPADTTYSTSASVSPSGSGLVYNNSTKMLQGTLADVGADTTYTVTVTRGNSYGSVTGSFTITATDVTPANPNDTTWSKALDFSGGSEYAYQVSNSNGMNPVNMSGLGLVVGMDSGIVGSTTSAHANTRPWAFAVTFNADGHNSNQHIVNFGEGAGSSDDNIYLRIDSSQNLYFGWGRDGALNECKLMPDHVDSNWDLTEGNWYTIYVQHDGRRFSGSDATASNLASAFDIRLMGSSGGYSGTPENLSVNPATDTAGNGRGWVTTGGRMDRTISGTTYLGGRGSNRSFHGKVSALVVTTLKRNQTLPTDAEIVEMMIDPVGWLNDYKVGQSFRYSSTDGVTSPFAINNSTSSWSTQVWLMGDGLGDSYSNMIRNQVLPNDQNYTMLRLNSMVSNDIQTVNIPGLSA
jgi:hypothetical protein